MAAVAEQGGGIKQAETRPYGEVAKGYTYFRENDVLFAKITPCMENGKITIARGLANGIGFGSTEFHVIRCGPDVLPEWVFAFVSQPAFRAAAQESFTGTAGQQRVPADFVKNSAIPLPPLPEQHRLVRLLDEADALRRLRARADERMADFIPALFHEMFGDPARNEKGWEIVSVSEFVEAFQAGRSILTSGTDDTQSKYGVLKVSAVTWKNYNPAESKPVPPNYVPQPSHFVKQGDLLFSRANTVELVGATSYVFETPPNMLIPDKLCRFVWRDPVRVEPLFVWCLFLHPSIRFKMGNRATGTGGSMKNISMPKVLSMNVPLPPLSLQHEFAARVMEARALEEKQAQSKARLEALFESMLARAFSGEL